MRLQGQVGCVRGDVIRSAPLIAPPPTSVNVPAHQRPTRKLDQHSVLTALDFSDTSDRLKVICNVSKIIFCLLVLLHYLLVFKAPRRQAVYCAACYNLQFIYKIILAQLQL